MKIGPSIREVNITPIAVSDPPLLNAAGVHAPFALRTIIELITEDGIGGVSEIPGGEEVNKSLHQIRPLVLGLDPFQLNTLQDRLTKALGTESNRGDTPWDQRKIVHIQSALEVACLDIIGKITDRPVFDLLGGKRREAVPFAAYLFYKYEGAGGSWGYELDPQANGWAAARQASAVNPEEVVDQAKSMCHHFGFQSIKLKGGAFPPEEELAAVQALHQTFGREVPLRFDPNGIWTLATAEKYGREMMPLLEYLEDPVRGQMEMASLRKKLNFPLATNMCTTSFTDLPMSFQLHSEDIILSDHHFWGGLQASMHLAKICQIFGRDLSMHSNSHVGISMAAMVHLGAAIPELPYALDTHYPWQSEEVIEEGRFIFEEGSVAVPSKPGLGVTLDRQALDKLHQNYLNCGLTERDDELEMQKLNPEWTFQPVRW